MKPLIAFQYIIFGAALTLFSACAHTNSVPTGTREGEDPFSQMIAVYRGPLNHLSAVRSGGCPMYPSCSDYSKQAIHKHGVFKGWIMTMDRLMRCGRDETSLSPHIILDNQQKIYDPLEANDFWLE